MSAPWQANKELNDRIYRIKMRGLVMRLRAEQRELEERYNHNHDSKGRFARSNISSVIIEYDDFSANKAVIDNKDYEKKFVGVTATSTGDKAVANAARRCINKNDGTLNETVVILSSGYGFSKGKDIDLGGSRGYINVPSGKANSLIIVHNHGNNSPFSFLDFMLVNDHPEIKTLIAAGHNGIVYKLTPKSGKRLDIPDKMTYTHYEKDFQRLYNSKTGYFDAIKKYSDLLGWDFEYE